MSEIKNTDFRIGNYVNVINDQYIKGIYQVWGISNKTEVVLDSEYLDRHIRNASPNIDFVGIPITEDVLIDCGFVKVGGKFWHKVRDFSATPSASLFLLSIEGKIVVAAQYLHQMQNCFHALTFEELTYTPKHK